MIAHAWLLPELGHGSSSSVHTASKDNLEKINYFLESLDFRKIPPYIGSETMGTYINFQLKIEN